MTLSPPETPNSTRDGSSLEHLHKMSRTAGLGSTDYVAVNTIAVATLILGLMSGLSLLGTALLVLPFATLVVGTIAIVQIRKSAGTQSGMVIALLGMVIALGFVTMVGGKELVRQRKEGVEQKQIETLIGRLGKAVAARDYPAAWGCFSPKAQEKSSEAAYADLWEKVQNSPMYGQIVSMRGNGFVGVSDDAESGELRARSIVLVKLTNDPEGKEREDRREATFVKGDDGTWLFESCQGFEPPVLGKPAAGQVR